MVWCSCNTLSGRTTQFLTLRSIRPNFFLTLWGQFSFSPMVWCSCRTHLLPANQFLTLRSKFICFWPFGKTKKYFLHVVVCNSSPKSRSQSAFPSKLFSQKQICDGGGIFKLNKDFRWFKAICAVNGCIECSDPFFTTVGTFWTDQIWFRSFEMFNCSDRKTHVNSSRLLLWTSGSEKEPDAGKCLCQQKLII